jgi:acetyl-CoA carboxylase biotin carboxyl carrier protein
VIALPMAGRGLSAEDTLMDPKGRVPHGKAKDIQALIDLAKRNNLAELEVERDGVRIRIRRDAGAGIPPALTRETPSPALEQPVETPLPPHSGEGTEYVTVTSPIVGTFYRSPSPDADPYIEEGDYVRKGQVLCIVEAMKLMNEIESEVDGRIVKIIVESTKPVEYGQPLFLIDPKATA